MKISATYKNMKSSPRKVGLVVDLIRGKKALDGLKILKFCKKKVSFEIAKLLKSAISNGENKKYNPDILFISNVEVGKGLLLRRFHARARSSSATILKRYSNVKIELSERWNNG